MTTWKIDPAHTDVLFSAKHMMVTTVRGTFTDVEGTLELDERDPSRSRGTVVVKAASLGTGQAARDGHLRSGDFFDVETWPEIRFVATAVEPVGGDAFRLTGDLTIRDVTRPVTFDAELLGFYASIEGGRRVGISARTRIDREDWGLVWNVGLEAGGWLVGKQVTIEIEVAAEEVALPVALPAGVAASAG